MKKIFISQPMQDKTDEAIKRERQRAIATIKERFKIKDAEILDSYFEGAPHDAKPLWFLGKSIYPVEDDYKLSRPTHIRNLTHPELELSKEQLDELYQSTKTNYATNYIPNKENKPIILFVSVLNPA